MSLSAPGPAWFCIRTRPKNEHIAAAHLSREKGIMVFNPQLRVRRATKRGPVWFQESLFPCYLFAFFDWESQMMEVKGTPGVSSLVSFGAEIPRVPDSVVEALRAQFQGDHPYVVEDTVEDGETVTLSGGAFHGLEVKVLKVMAPSGRVQVLMDLLGRCAQVEVEISQVSRSAGTNMGLENSIFGKHGAPISDEDSQR